MGKNKKRKLSSSKNDDHGGGPDAVKENSHGDALVNSQNNPLYKEQQLFLSKLTPKERNFYFSSSAITPDRRAALWMEQADIGEGLVNQYAWATPTMECLPIFREFSPIVEIGSGSNAYWANYIQKQLAQDIHIVAFDMNVDEGGKIPSKASKKKKAKNSSGDQKDTIQVQKGGPEVLKRRELRNHTLFLCYPDEEDAPILLDDEDDDDEQDSTSPPPLSFGWQCLNEYKGKFVIHVGELALLGDATLNMEQSPWGRSSSPEFQQRLASEFHCIAKIPLPNWLHVRDSISVWKRSEICQMTFVGDEDDEDDEEEIIEYRHVPPEEMLPQRAIAPCLEHIFAPSLPANNATPTSKSRPNEMETNEKTTDPDDGTAGKELSTSSTKSKTDDGNEIGQTKKTKRGKRRERQKQKKKLSLQSSSSPNDGDDDEQNKKKMKKKARSDYFKIHGKLPPQS